MYWTKLHTHTQTVDYDIDEVRYEHRTGEGYVLEASIISQVGVWIDKRAAIKIRVRS